MGISLKIAKRIASGLKRYQSILAAAKQRDISESDTVVIVADMLSDILGYDKYQHVTTEFSIRGTYVDLAVKVDNAVRFLIEVKAIGHELKDGHVKQAIDYGANEGIEWVILTNGANWRMYKIHFGQPIDKSLVFEVDIGSANPKSRDVIQCFGSLCRESFSKSSMTDLFQQKQVTGKFYVASVLLGDKMIMELRRELRRLSPGLKVEEDYLRALLEHEVIKRELVDSDEAKVALATKKRLQKTRDRERKREPLQESDASEPSAMHPAPAAR